MLKTKMDETPGKRGPRGARGDVAAAIVSAARTQFSAHGYSGTTLSAIAAAAKVDPALIAYYFKNKRGLLEVCLEPPSGLAENVVASSGSPIESRGRALLETMLRQWENPEFAEVFRSIILIAAQEEIAMKRLRGMFASVILGGMAAGLDEDARELRAGLVSSQIIGVAMARYVWKLEPMASLSPGQVVDYISPTLQRYVDGNF
jgi:AcrR family transcriptional regulator